MENLGALKILAYSGGGWVIYLLLACSVLTVGVFFERWTALRRENKALAALRDRAAALLEEGDLDAAARAAEALPGTVSAILLSALRHVKSGPDSVEEHVAASRIRERKKLDERMLVLGTLGNNAPFIGLFGTVLGVIKAFHDLSQSGAGPEVVMAGLSEALVATAIGLLVAIPAVIAYNYFIKSVNDLLADADGLVRLLMAHLKDKARTRN